MKLYRMIIERSGELIFRVSGDRHCGPQEFATPLPGQVQVMTARYTFRVTCKPILDPRGFLFDQATLQGFVKGVVDREAYQSCERLATDLGAAFLANVTKEHPTCHIMQLDVTISPAPHAASITAGWVREAK